MREFDALSGYPEPKHPRVVSSNLRTIHHRIVASYRDKEFYDGDRNYGYGGFLYDGRWLPIAKNMCQEYDLNAQSAVLQVGCDKGFLLHDFLQVYPSIKVRGTELSDYAIEHSMDSVKPHLQKAPFTVLPFEDQEFDFVIALGPVYTLNLGDAIQYRFVAAHQLQASRFSQSEHHHHWIRPGRQSVPLFDEFCGKILFSGNPR